MTPNECRLGKLRRLVREYRPDCVIELIWQARLTYDIESHRVRRLVEQELRPALPAHRDRLLAIRFRRIAVRVEALFETVRGRQPAVDVRCP